MPAATVDHSQRICEVWASNLEEELKRIRQVIRKYSYIAMVSLVRGILRGEPFESELNACFSAFIGH